MITGATCVLPRVTKPSCIEPKPTVKMYIASLQRSVSHVSTRAGYEDVVPSTLMGTTLFLSLTISYAAEIASFGDEASSAYINVTF